jgi:hypothetical protein
LYRRVGSRNNRPVGRVADAMIDGLPIIKRATCHSATPGPGLLSPKRATVERGMS